MQLLHTTIDFLAAVAPHAAPDPGPPTVPPGMEKLTAILGWAKWIALAVVIAGLFAIGAKLAIETRRGEGGAHLGSLGAALFGLVVIAGATSMVGFFVA